MTLSIRRFSEPEARRVSTVRVVDSLAEITRYKDRELLERSLVTTLSELFPEGEFWLYRVIESNNELELTLLIYARDGTVVAGPYPRQNPSQMPERLVGAIGEAILSKEVAERYNPDSSSLTLVYPIYDKRDEIRGLLLQKSKQSCFDIQRLIYGLLRIYSNYFSLLEESHRDKLTNLLNRETLETEIAKRIIFQSQRARHRGSQRREEDRWHDWLAVIDADHFKRINDEWGHLYGDEVLILLARLLETVFRDEDMVFRYGGEEFVALFRTPRLEDARTACERARLAVAEHAFPGVGRVTVSIGVVEVLGQDSPAMAIEQADQALYYAKEHGRDRTCFHAVLVAEGALGESGQRQQGSVDFF